LDYKLGTTKEWFIGFFDIGSNVGATSDIFALALESGKRE